MRCNNELFLKDLESLISIFKGERKNLLDFVECLLKRIERFDNKINSYININDKILKHAERVSSDTLFSGLPIAVKDLIDTREIITTYGSPFFSNHLPENDALAISYIKRNGGTILGKTNTHQFALGIVTPPTKNPWDLNRIPGGSSGGSAASVAAGLSVLSIGTDTGGSIRIPASMCGVTGLKPSYGKLPMEGVFPESFSEDHLGPICRYASDLRMVLKGLGARKIPNRERKVFKVGLITNFFEESDKNIKNTVMKAIDKLESEDIIEEITYFEIPDLNKIRKYHNIMDMAETYFHHSRKFLRKKLQYPSDVKEEIDSGARIRTQDYIYSVRYKQFSMTEFSRNMKGTDILLSPTLPKSSPTIKVARRMKLKDHFTFTKFLTPFNYLGVPALTIPCGFSLGLPVGLQIISKYGHDTNVIDFGSEYQKVSDWHKKIPEKFL